jgi:hypothetical protein
MLCLLRLQEIHLEMASSMPAVAGGGLEAAVARAQAYERGNDFARAIEAYLSLSPADTNNMDALQQCWEQVRREVRFDKQRVLVPCACLPRCQGWWLWWQSSSMNA